MVSSLARPTRRRLGRWIYGDEKYDRLVAVKGAWDPEKVFHLNQNIKPRGRSLLDGRLERGGRLPASHDRVAAEQKDGSDDADDQRSQESQRRKPPRAHNET